MFKYFPTNYPWNLSVNLSIEMCAPLTEAAKSPDAAGTEAFRATWVQMAEKLISLAEDDMVAGRMISAGDKLLRAANYMITAERLLGIGSPGRAALYARFQAIFAKGLTLSGATARRVQIPYEGSFLSAIFVPAQGATGAQPVLMQVNELDSTKEMKYLVGLPGWLAQRGVASLIVDQPGTGDALRQRGLVARFDSEHWAARVVDWLEGQPDIDPKRNGMEGVSLGGYNCPRAATRTGCLPLPGWRWVCSP